MQAAPQNPNGIRLLAAYYTSQPALEDDLNVEDNMGKTVEYTARYDDDSMKLISKENRKYLRKKSIKIFRDRFGHFPTNDRIAKMEAENEGCCCVVQ